MEIDDKTFFGGKKGVKILLLKSEKRWRLVKKINQEVEVLNNKVMESRKIETNKNRICNIEGFTKTKRKHHITKCMSPCLEYQHLDHLKIPETNKNSKISIKNSKTHDIPVYRHFKNM